MDENSTPCVSIIVPTYNRADLLKEALNSIVSQTFTSWEIIAVDDHSTDHTEEIIKSFVQQDATVQYLKNPTGVKGAHACRNSGLEAAKGQYIIFLDSDDLLAPHCLESRVAVMNSDASLDFAVFQCHKFRQSPNDPDQELWCEWSTADDLDSFLAQQVPWQTTGPIWRREALKKVGAWNQTLPSGQDFEFHIRALAKDLRYKKIDIVDYFWRMPRIDSMSDFESKKRKFAKGAVAHCFLAVLETLIQEKKITPFRSKLLEADARRISVTTLLYGGNRELALKPMRALCQHSLITGHRYFEYYLAFICWGKIFNRIPTLSYLNWRFGGTHPAQ